MATYYAEINDESIVIRVLVVSDENGSRESDGIAFLKELLGEDRNWAKTYKNGQHRYNYAGIGYTWDNANKAFYPPRPFASWSLDEEYQWEAPTAYPDDGEMYSWDEDELKWVRMTP